MSLSGCQINPIDVNFHLQKSLEIFGKNSADEVWSKKDREWKLPCLMPIRVKRRPKVNSLVKSTYINIPTYMVQVILFASPKKCWVFLCKFKAMFGSWGSDFPLCHSRPSMQLSMYVVSEELSKKYVWHRARREDYKWPPISLWVWHRLRMHDGYFPNSFRTMSYLGFISVRSEMQSF